MTNVNKFYLHKEIYLYKKVTLVKIYTPTVFLEDKHLFWIY